MMRSMYSGVSGLKNHQTRMDVIGNNIANVNTIAYKASRVNFHDVFSQTLKAASGATANSGGTNPVQVGLGVGLGSIDVLFTRAAAQRTDYALDLSIEGDGFFVVNDGTDEIYYTRAGNFRFDESGNLVNASGLFVLDSNGQKISLGNVSYHDITINKLGQLTGIEDGQSVPTVIATLGIAVFSNNSGLSKVGDNLYAQTSSSGEPQAGVTIDPDTGDPVMTVYKAPGEGGAGFINPGTLEMSNVDLANEFTDMIVTQRGFQANSRVITTSDQMLEELVNLKR